MPTRPRRCNADEPRRPLGRSASGQLLGVVGSTPGSGLPPRSTRLGTHRRDEGRREGRRRPAAACPLRPQPEPHRRPRTRGRCPTKGSGSPAGTGVPRRGIASSASRLISTHATRTSMPWASRTPGSTSPIAPSAPSTPTSNVRVGCMPARSPCRELDLGPGQCRCAAHPTPLGPPSRRDPQARRRASRVRRAAALPGLGTP